MIATTASKLKFLFRVRRIAILPLIFAPLVSPTAFDMSLAVFVVLGLLIERELARMISGTRIAAGVFASQVDARRAERETQS